MSCDEYENGFTMKYIIAALALIFSMSVSGQEATVQDPVNGQTGDLNTNTQNNNSTVNSNNTSSDASKTVNNYGAGAGQSSPVMSAVAPSLISTGQDTCLRSTGAALQLNIAGLSGGGYVQDEECNRRRDTKLFKDLGLSIVAISRMCQNEDNWKAMFMAGSPCPIVVGGKMVFGKRAVLVMKQNPGLYIPTYKDTDFWGNYKNKDFYDKVLGIGENPNESKENADDISISERFRSTTSK